MVGIVPLILVYKVYQAEDYLFNYKYTQEFHAWTIDGVVIDITGKTLGKSYEERWKNIFLIFRVPTSAERRASSHVKK